MEREAELCQDAGDGQTVFTHLRKAERMAGRRMPELELPEVPECGEYLMRAFTDLNAQRGSSGFGPCRITLEAMAAWARFNRVQLTAWEVATLMAMDSAMLGKSSKARGG